MIMSDLAHLPSIPVRSDAVVTLSEALSSLVPQREVSPVDMPGAVEVTSEQRLAIASLEEAIASGVVPETRRRLSAEEVLSLLHERGLLDEVERLIDARKASHRATLFNHFDVDLEDAVRMASKTGSKIVPPPVDAKGHYLAPAETGVAGPRFTREVRVGQPTITVDSLASLEASGAIDHADFLAMTSQVREVDPVKVLDWIKSHPARSSALAPAIIPGKSIGSLNVRKS
jgi:hypothetical protein